MDRLIAMLIRRAAPLLACAFLGVSAAFADGPPGTDLEGCWECTNARPRVMFRFTPKKAFYWLDGMLAIGPAKYGANEVSFPAMGRKQAYHYTLDGAKLTLQSPMSGTFLCRKLDACPPDLADPK